ncbi:hypothetical protein D9M72_578780 [compost metagenome]
MSAALSAEMYCLSVSSMACSIWLRAASEPVQRVDTKAMAGSACRVFATARSDEAGSSTRVSAYLDSVAQIGQLYQIAVNISTSATISNNPHYSPAAGSSKNT